MNGVSEPNNEANIKPETKPDQIWLVDYECRADAVRISLKNEGFYAFGQDPLWAFSAVSKWHKCLYDPSQEVSEI